MWSSQRTALGDGRGLLLTLHHQQRPATFSQIIQGWRTDASLRSHFSSLLAALPYEAVKWETPALTRAAMDRPFECVVLDSPWLDRPPDPDTFASFFCPPPGDVVRFANLGGDALMVVPCPRAPASAYGHLLAFLRHAPAAQQQRLWVAVAQALDARLGTRPVWLSTAGGGVSWLHVRLDDRPKYYGHVPYRSSERRQRER